MNTEEHSFNDLWTCL